ncbi:MAG: DNA polymerase III subunit gamma/tau [Gemmatimonadaceae bacterium]
MSLALARKYRPKTFADVAVQSHVSNTLRGAIARGRVAHGYLLCGPRGVGKTTLARVLAMALNCENKRDDGEPCGVCTSCQRIWSGSSSLDVVEIDAASNRGVDDARELRERAMYAPSGEDRYKVYIVDEAHMLTREAWNALLKILEEPPPRVIFVFATTEPQKIAQAAAPVLSRLQRFDLKRIGLGDIIRRLDTILESEGVKASPEALSMIARAADGSMRDALSLTDQVISIGEGAVTPERVREALGLVPEDEFLAILDIIADHHAGDVFEAVNKLTDAGVDFGVFLSGFADMLRALLAVVLNGRADGVSAAAAAALAKRKELFSAGDLLRMIGAVNALEPTFRKSGQQQLLIEMLLVRMALLDRTVEIEDLLRGLNAAPSRGEDREPQSGSVRTQPAQASVARSAHRPSTRPGYPPQLTAPNSLAAESPARTQSTAPNEAQLSEMKRAMEATAQDSNRSRMTPEALKEERIGMLRQKDPALGAAIDELDLELLD